MKRIVIATVFGLAAGVLCAIFTFTGGLVKFTGVFLAWILLNRAVMGFAIGASGLKLHWAWNGALMGLIVGSIFSYSLYMTTGSLKLLLLNPVGNVVFGLMIEFFTSYVFKQRIIPEPCVKERAAAA